MIRVAICAPSTPFTREDAARVGGVARAFPGIELHFHEQCYAVDGHFAGSDDVRLAAFLECANDPAFDAVWFVRGGYGANRIAQAAVERLDHVAGRKAFLAGAFVKAWPGILLHIVLIPPILLALERAKLIPLAD